MPKRAWKKVPKVTDTRDSVERLRNALAKRTKGDLIERPCRIGRR